MFNEEIKCESFKGYGFNKSSIKTCLIGRYMIKSSRQQYNPDTKFGWLSKLFGHQITGAS